MIPNILIVLGIFFIFIGCLCLMLVAVSPFFHKLQIILIRKDDYVLYETPVGKNLLKETTKKFIRECIIGIVMGLVLIFSGIFLGFSEKGDGFWLYNSFLGQESADEWDKIDADGKYVSNGKKYVYYIEVRGTEYRFNDKACSNFDELKEKISAIRRENTVALIDNYAVASEYHKVEDALKELGIKYEKTEE